MAEKALVYLDNNATTLMPPAVVNTVYSWINRGDPSAEHRAARETQKMVHRFRRYLAAKGGGYSLEGLRGYTLVFTNGGAESNALVLMSAARAYATRTKRLPHIVTSAAEHESTLDCCQQLLRDKMIQLTVLPVRKAGTGGRTGTVEPGDLRKALRANTCLVSIIAANHETGALNPVQALGAVAHEQRVPFHSDVAQLFGRDEISPADLNLDAFSVSFHKLHAPPGVGLLALRNDFVAGYRLESYISGRRPHMSPGGGMANGSGIAGAFAATRLALTDRAPKNRRLRALRDRIWAALAQRFLAVHVDEYCEARPRAPDGDPMTPESSRVAVPPRTARGAALARQLDAAAELGAPVLVWLGPPDPADILPNTLLLSVFRLGDPDSGKKLRASLEASGFVVGGSTSQHQAEAMDAPPELWAGLVRISLSDETTEEQATEFVEQFASLNGARGPGGAPG